jgi:ribose transport system permease protein
MNQKSKIIAKRLMGKPETSSILILTIMLIIMVFLEPRFFTVGTLGTTLEGFLPLILLAMGQAVVIIAGGLDLSCATAMALIVCVMAFIMQPDQPMSGVVAVLVGFAVAMGTGLVNGLAVAYFRLPPVIATYAASFVWLGIALFVMPIPGGHVVPWFRGFYRLNRVPALENIGIPTALLWIIVACIVWFIISKSKTGRYLYAVGSNRENAYLSGIRPERIRMISYLINALFVYFTALFMLAQNMAGNPRLGDAMLLRVIAAAAVGGVALSGGKGSVYMALVGAVIMNLVTQLIFSANLHSDFQVIVSGFIIIIAISISALYTIQQNKVQVKGGMEDE